MGKKKRTFKITAFNLQPKPYSPEWVAIQAKKAMDYLTPLIKKQNLPANEALVLVAMHMDYQITGKQRYISEEQIFQICHMITTAWEHGLLKPSASYPYTLEQTLAAGKSEDEE